MTERRRQETERDKELRQAAGSTLLQLQDTLTNALAMVEDHQDHPGIQPQAQKGDDSECDLTLPL